jgi:hypothetical protein
MSDLRELTNAELDVVGGGLMSAHACHSAGPANFAAVRSQPPCGRENLVLELIADVLRLLAALEKGAPNAQRAKVANVA